ncbi:hypothetical protein LEMLEM_LOCUS15078 [Lemmus lemmus]
MEGQWRRAPESRAIYPWGAKRSQPGRAHQGTAPGARTRGSRRGARSRGPRRGRAPEDRAGGARPRGPDGLLLVQARPGLEPLSRPARASATEADRSSAHPLPLAPPGPRTHLAAGSGAFTGRASTDARGENRNRPWQRAFPPHPISGLFSYGSPRGSKRSYRDGMLTSKNCYNTIKELLPTPVKDLELFPETENGSFSKFFLAKCEGNRPVTGVTDKEQLDEPALLSDRMYARNDIGSTYLQDRAVAYGLGMRRWRLNILLSTSYFFGLDRWVSRIPHLAKRTFRFEGSAELVTALHFTCRSSQLVLVVTILTCTASSNETGPEQGQTVPHTRQQGHA